MSAWWSDQDERRYQHFAELIRAGYSHDVALLGADMLVERERAIAGYHRDMVMPLRLFAWTLSDIRTQARAEHIKARRGLP